MVSAEEKCVVPFDDERDRLISPQLHTITTNIGYRNKIQLETFHIACLCVCMCFFTTHKSAYKLRMLANTLHIHTHIESLSDVNCCVLSDCVLSYFFFLFSVSCRMNPTESRMMLMMKKNRRVVRWAAHSYTQTHITHSFGRIYSILSSSNTYLNSLQFSLSLF